MSGVEPPRAAFYGALKQHMDPFMAETRRRIRILGLGNIGFRHLQGLSPIADRIQLQGRDPSGEAVARAQAEWANIPGSEGDFGPARTEDGPADLVVIATSAIGREALLTEQIKGGVRSFLLEKVVFTEPAAFERARDALAERNATAFVNTARRMWPIYKDLAAAARKSDQPISLQISGRSLGLACNGVHFLDLLQMLSGDQHVRLVDGQTSVPWTSKRQGYYEVWGKARFETANGSTLDLTIEADTSEAQTILANIAGKLCVIDESSGTISDRDGAVLSHHGRSPFQSELSATYAEALLAGRSSDLPTLAESERAHLALFELLTPAFNAAGLVTGQGLPIS